MKSTRGFSTILIVIIMAVVLGIVGLNYANKNLRGTKIEFGTQPKSPISESKEPSSENTNQESKLDIKEIEKFYPVKGITLIDTHAPSLTLSDVVLYHNSSFACPESCFF